LETPKRGGRERGREESYFIIPRTVHTNIYQRAVNGGEEKMVKYLFVL